MVWMIEKWIFLATWTGYLSSSGMYIYTFIQKILNHLFIEFIFLLDLFFIIIIIIIIIIYLLLSWVSRSILQEEDPFDRYILNESQDVASWWGL